MTVRLRAARDRAIYRGLRYIERSTRDPQGVLGLGSALLYALSFMASTARDGNVRRPFGFHDRAARAQIRVNLRGRRRAGCPGVAGRKKVRILRKISGYPRIIVAVEWTARREPSRER